MATSIPNRRALALLVALAACSRDDKSKHGVSFTNSSAPAPLSQQLSGEVEVREWSFGATNERAVVLIPKGAESARYPVVIALHGRGEALKGPGKGEWGWPRDYELMRAVLRITHPPLTKEDFGGFIGSERLDAVSSDLGAHPFGGLIVVCPYLPDVNLQSQDELAKYGRFITERVIPRITSETPSSGKIGIDGISLGGAISLSVGLAAPQLFSSIGGLQVAMQEGEVAGLTERFVAAKTRNAALVFRIATSHDDPFHDPIAHLSESLKRAGVTHEYLDLPGPHDYVWNRGPGAYELLYFHERALSRVPDAGVLR